MNQSQVNMVKAIERFSEFLKSAETNKIPVEEFEDYYKKLRGIKQLFENAPWDEIEREEGMEEVTLCRSDNVFKEYYKHRQELDRLEVFVR